MKLNRVEKIRLEDARLRIQSIVNALSSLDCRKIPNYDGIHACLRDAEKSLALALRSDEPN